jgi:pilus assembly protein CpaE
MTNKIYLIKLALKKPTVNDDLIKIIRALGDFEIMPPGDNRKPDLLICELGKKSDKDFAMIESLLNQDVVGDVFLISDITEPRILMKAIRIGVKEFFPLPIETGEVRQALQRFKDRKKDAVSSAISETGQIITTFGSKGGVGTTTVAVNLAVTLSLREERPNVALIDMNTLFGEIPLFLEISPQFHWGEITRNIDRLDNAFLSNVLTRHNTGVNILPSPAYLNGHIRPTPEAISRLLELMKTMFDYIIIDGGQSTDDTSLRIVELTDTLLLITILSLPCLANANKLVKSFIDLGYLNSDRIKVVLNRYMKKSEISLRDAESGINKKLFWIIPNDYRTTMSAINKGRPLAKIAPKAQITQAFGELAGALACTEPQEDQKKKWTLFKRSNGKV